MKTFLKSNKKPNPHVRAIVVTFRVNSEEMRFILRKVHAFSKGDVSKWARAAAIHWTPKKEDLEK